MPFVQQSSSKSVEPSGQQTWAARPLLEACAGGRDERAWIEFVRRYGRRLQAGVRRGLRRARRDETSEDVEDLLQDVYCHLLEGGGYRLLRPRGTSDPEISSYLGRLAENVVLDRIRAARASKRSVSVIPWQEDSMEAVARRSLSPEERVLLREREAQFARDCRIAAAHSSRSVWMLRMAILEGWSSQEISRALGARVSPANVDAVLHRLRRRLRRYGYRPVRR